MNSVFLLTCDTGEPSCLNRSDTSSGSFDSPLTVDPTSSIPVVTQLSSINFTDPFTNDSVSKASIPLVDPVNWFRVYGWKDFQRELRWGLPVHIYGFACLFFMLSFYTFFSILNLRSQLTTRPFMSTINVFVCILGVSRATCFIIDPYCSQKIIPRFLGWVLWDVGYPCILSAFGLIQLAFSQLTQMTFRPESLRKKSSLSVIIATHFICLLASNVVAAFDNKLEVVRIIVQAIFLSWGIVLCCTFLYGGGRILRLLKTLPNSAFQNTDPIPEHKGILQLALLAQCNNIASSVISTAGPSIMAPKIKITDENDLSFSVGSEASKLSSATGVEAGGDGGLSTLPEINITEADSPTNAEVLTPDKNAFNQPVVKIEICEATPETPVENKLLQELESCVVSLETADDVPPRTPKRKKSLTWVDETIGSPEGGGGGGEVVSPSTSKGGCAGATLGCEISNNERRKRRGSSEASSRRSSNTSTISSRKSSGAWDSASRKGSYCSVASYRQGSYCSEFPSRKNSSCYDGPSRKGSHVGEALVLSRRSSLCSDASSRRGSNQCLTHGAPGSRRGSSRNPRDETESESLLRRTSAVGSDVTLSSILNHIAYANQANAASKLCPKFKESRKEQVRQVLIVTYVTAVLGMALSLFMVIGLYSHPPPASPVPPWLWFSYESACRLLEFLIGCAMANITRQPVNRPSQYGSSLRVKACRSSIYM